MADEYSELSPLMARHLIGFCTSYMDPKADHEGNEIIEEGKKQSRAIWKGHFVPVPMGCVTLYEKTVRKLGFDGPFVEFNGRLKPLLDKYDRKRFSGIMNGIEPDGEHDGKPYLWVAMVPYRIFETFCNQHIHGWWHRYNLTRGVLEFVSFSENNIELELVQMFDVDKSIIENTPAWEKTK